MPNADEIMSPAEVQELAERAEVDEGVRDPRAAVKSKIARLATSHEALRRRVVEVLEPIVQAYDNGTVTGDALARLEPALITARDLLSKLRPDDRPEGGEGG